MANIEMVQAMASIAMFSSGLTVALVSGSIFLLNYAAPGMCRVLRYFLRRWHAPKALMAILPPVLTAAAYFAFLIIMSKDIFSMAPLMGTAQG